MAPYSYLGEGVGLLFYLAPFVQRIPFALPPNATSKCFFFHLSISIRQILGIYLYKYLGELYLFPLIFQFVYIAPLSNQKEYITFQTSSKYFLMVKPYGFGACYFEFVYQQN